MKKKRIKLFPFSNVFVIILSVYFFSFLLLEGELLWSCIVLFIPIIFSTRDFITVWKSRLKRTGQCIRLPIISIEENRKVSMGERHNRRFLQYVIVGNTNKDDDLFYSYNDSDIYNRTYKSPEVFYDLYSMFREGDTLAVYIDPKKPKRYFVDLNSCENSQNNRQNQYDHFTGANHNGYFTNDNLQEEQFTLEEALEIIRTGEYKDKTDIKYTKPSDAKSNTDSTTKDSPYGGFDNDPDQI